jgi:hypothetical protein
MMSGRSSEARSAAKFSFLAGPGVDHEVFDMDAGYFLLGLAEVYAAETLLRQVLGIPYRRPVGQHLVGVAERRIILIVIEGPAVFIGLIVFRLQRGNRRRLRFRRLGGSGAGIILRVVCASAGRTAVLSVIAGVSGTLVPAAAGKKAQYQKQRKDKGNAFCHLTYLPFIFLGEEAQWTVIAAPSVPAPFILRFLYNRPSRRSAGLQQGIQSPPKNF